MNETTTVAWISRHTPIPAQIKELKDILGDVTVVQVSNTYTNYYNIIEAVRTLNAKYAVLVLPLSMIHLILKEGIDDVTWLRADMRPAHAGRCDGTGTECSTFNKDTDVLMPVSNGNGSAKAPRHIRFTAYSVLKSICIEIEPFGKQAVS